MRRASTLEPKRFDGLPERVIIQLDNQDFDQIINPNLVKFSKKPKFGVTKTTVDILCNLLETWGDCSTEMIDYIKESKKTDPVEIHELLQKMLSAKSIEDFINENPIHRDDE